MAMFPTHIKCSTLAGIGGGIAAYTVYGVPLTTSVVGAGMCAIGGILPDIDSGPGIPLREITTFLASVVPTMLITRLLSYKFTQETLILTGAILYIGIRFGLAHFLRHYTIHRGMFHSFPSMAIFGELTYLLFYGETMFVRMFMVSAVCFGFFIHLLLDEIYSVEWDGTPRLKKSFGTAMKFVGEGWWPNATCYGKLAVLTYFVLHDPSVVHQIYAGNGPQVAQNLGQAVKNELNSATAKIRAKTSGAAPVSSQFGGPAARPDATAANSATVPPATMTWPATVPSAGFVPPATSYPASTQAAPAAVNWQPPASPPHNPAYSANAIWARPAAPAAGNAAPPPSTGRFWQ